MRIFTTFLTTFLVLMALAVYCPTAKADQNGKLVVTPVNCANGAFSSIQKICQLVDKLGAGCSVTSNSCVEASQEVFTGNLIEFASPTNIKAWNGMGGLGQPYGVATTCLLRDISDFSGKKVATSATANTFLGDITANQEVRFSSFNKATGAFEGYQRLQTCGPAVGCLDAITQKFRLTPVAMDVTSLGKTAGQYQIRQAYALEFWAEGFSQGLSVSLPGISVPTPIGDVQVEPQFRFGRAGGFAGAPFDGNTMSSFPDSGIGLSSNHVYDVYGRIPGTGGTELSPISPGTGASPWSYQPKGWISQMGLGSRDANPDHPTWKTPPGVSFPSRPDLDVTIARSNGEKAPNAYLGASIKATYSIDKLIPQFIKDIGCGGIVSVCLDQADVFAEPSIDVGFMSQFSVHQSEQSSWNGTLLPNHTTAVPDLRPQNLDQAKGIAIRMDSSTAAKFSLNAGMDLVISLSIDTFFTSIHKKLIDLQPRTTIASSTTSGNSANTKSADVKSYASKIISTKKLFQNYTTLKGTNLADGPTDGGTQHIKACLAKASESAPPPPAPTYTPGDVSILLNDIGYPCNVCVGWNEVDYLDNNKHPQKVAGYLASWFPASEATRPPEVRWSCKDVLESGCYDMCSMDKNGKLKVVETALELIAKGQAKGMPGTCARGH